MLVLLLTTVAPLQTYFAKTELVKLCTMKGVFSSLKKVMDLKKNFSIPHQDYMDKK